MLDENDTKLPKKSRPCDWSLEAPEREEKHPGIIVDPSGKNPPRCLRCGRDMEVVRYYAKLGEEWALCQTCGCAYRIEREKGEK